MELVKIGKVKGNESNPRFIKEDKFEKLVKSIKDFPEMLKLRPIVVNKDMTVLGGNMRLKACVEAGLKEVYILKAEGLTEDQEKEFIVKDNLGFGEWDWDVLANEWDSVQLEEWGLEGFPFEDIELDAVEDDYSEPDSMKVDVVLGDLIEIGEHRLLCGDSTDSDQVAKLMNGEKADMVFTDPPYGGDLLSHTNNPKGKFQKAINKVSSNTNFMSKFNPKDLLAVLSWLDAPSSYVFTDLTLLKDYIFKNSKVLVWDKKIGMPSVGNYNSNIEFIVFTKKQGALFNNGMDGVKYGRVIRMAKKDRDLHPTMKPIELIENCIKISSNRYNLIVDLFLGSGSTMAAAHQLKRKCYGMELDPKYCQVIIDRMMKLDDSLKVKINGKKYSKK